MSSANLKLTRGSISNFFIYGHMYQTDDSSNLFETLFHKDICIGLFTRIDRVSSTISMHFSSWWCAMRNKTQGSRSIENSASSFRLERSFKSKNNLQTKFYHWYRNSLKRYTCLYLATKTENFYISLDTYKRHLIPAHILAKDIASSELAVSTILGFQYAVYHGHIPLHGISLDMQVIQAPFSHSIC